MASAEQAESKPGAPEALAVLIFILTMVGIVLWVGAVVIFVL